MERMWASVLRRFASVLLPSLVSGCVILVGKVEVTPVRATTDSVTIGEPVKVHLRDGSTVVYRDGLTMLRDSILGTGMRYGLTLRDSTAIEAVSLDRVAAMERFDTRVQSGSSAGISLGLTALLVAVAAGLFATIRSAIDPGG